MDARDHLVRKATPWRGGAQLFVTVEDDAAHEARGKVKYNKWTRFSQVGRKVQEAN